MQGDPIRVSFDTQAAVTLFLLPPAGAGANFYRPLIKNLPADLQPVPLVPSGRESRWGEPLKGSVEEHVADYLPHFDRWIERPWVLLGHSLGALVAYELVNAILRRYGVTPLGLVVSASRAPYTDPASDGSSLHGLPDQQFIAAVVAHYGAIPAEILVIPELMIHYLPMLRADFQAAECYCCDPSRPLEMPLAIFGASGDEAVPRQLLNGWLTLACGGAIQREFPGGHHYLRDQPELAANELTHFIRQLR
ncbi:MAG: thioesterase II family protein [Candidatus Competibacterales bacterium]